MKQRMGRILLGAASGLVATWAMTRATTWLYAREDPEARRREDAAREGRSAYGVAADRAAHLVGRELEEDQRRRWGNAIHWTLGTSAGAAYGAMEGAARRQGWAWGAGRSLAFGTAFFLLVDELANVALRLTPGPRRFPWQAHARGLAGHLVYGLAAWGTWRLLRAPRLLESRTPPATPPDEVLQRPATWRDPHVFHAPAP